MMSPGMYKIITSIVLTILPILLFQQKKWKYKRNYEILTQTKNYFYKFLFITYKNRVCGKHINTRIECSPKCSYRYFKNIINIIDSAKRTISVCIYHFTIDDIYSAILRAQKRGVLVRCITDYTMAYCTGSKIKNFELAGVHVRVQPKSSAFMHHKFILIDANDPVRQTLLFGSVNFTFQAFVNNWEHLTYTNNAAMITRFSEEFEIMWSNFVKLE